MTERTVEVEVTETQQETVSICDHCGLEVDGDGVSYLPIEAIDSERNSLFSAGHPPPVVDDFRDILKSRGMVLAKVDQAHGHIHFHEQCLRDATLSDIDEVRAVTWNDFEEVDSPVMFAFHGISMTVFVLGLGGLAVALATGGVLGMAPGLIGLGFTSAALAGAWKAAHRPDEFLKRRMNL